MPDETKFWRYDIPNEKGQGWGILFLDQKGCFAALSDWGDYSYRWAAHKDMREFILQCGDDYIMDKLSPRSKMEYDGIATCASVKEQIIENRKDLLFDKEEAFKEWELVIDCHQLEEEGDFRDWASQTEMGDASEFYCKRQPVMIGAFIKNMLPKFREAIRLDLGLK